MLRLDFFGAALLLAGLLVLGLGRLRSLALALLLGAVWLLLVPEGGFLADRLFFHRNREIVIAGTTLFAIVLWSTAVGSGFAFRRHRPYWWRRRRYWRDRWW